MKFYCLERFKTEFDKLSKKRPYKNLEKELIDYFFGKSVEELRNGVNLNNNSNTPYLKKRLSGKGGFRFYFLLVIKNECLYFMFVHPKTGPDGASNIADKSKSEIYKEVLEAIKQDNLYELSCVNKKLVFETKKKPLISTSK